MKHYNFVFFLLISLASVPVLHGVIAGSDESVSIQSHVVFPAADNDNIMKGFSFFRNGFGLEDATTTCTFDSINPISGLVDFNGGTVVLTQNLTMKDLIIWDSFGTINGQGVNYLDLTRAVFSGSLSGSPTFQDVNLYINGNFVLPTDFHFKGVCTVFGNGSTVTLFDGVGSLIVDPGSSLTLQNMIINDVSGNKLRCADDTATLILDEVTIVQSGDFSFSQGSITFINNVDILGSFTFIYDTAQTSTIEADSRLRFLQGVLSIGRFATGAPEPLIFTDRTSLLHLDKSFLDVTQYGWQLINGTLQFTGNVIIDSTGTSTVTDMARALEYGNGIPANDVIQNYDPGSSVTYTRGITIFNNSQINRFGGKGSSPITNLGAQSINIFPRDIIAHNLTFQVETGAVVIFNPSISVFLDNVGVTTPGLFSDLFNGFLLNNATFFLMNGNNSIELLSGNLPFATQVANANNVISGSGNVGQAIILLGPSAELIWQASGSLLSPGTIFLNGGTTLLKSTFNLGNNVVINGPGTVNLDDQVMQMGNNDTSWSTPIDWQGVNGIIDLKGNVELSNVWTFSGTCQINGNGNNIDLNDTGEIIVAPGSVLILRNVTLNNVKGTNIRCADNSARIVLDSVLMIQSDDYSFSAGSFSFIDQVDWQGSFTFTYDTIQSSTIQTQSALHMFNGITLSIGRSADNAVEPLIFTDSTSTLNVEDATLNITSHGARFTKGIFESTGLVTIKVNSTSVPTALIFGNGNAADDIALQFDGGSLTNFNNGLVDFNVTTFEIITPQGGTATLQQSAASINRFEQNYVVSNIIFNPITGSQIQVAPGKTLSVHNMTVLTANGGTYTVTGIFQVGVGWLLPGNGSMLINSGALAVALLVTGTGNFLGGAGDINLPIIFLNSSAQLSWALTGQLNTNISMNGGNLSLITNLNMGHDVVLSGTSRVDMNNKNVNLGDTTVNWTNPALWDGSTGVINLTAAAALSNTWTFSGLCILDGNGNTLDIENGNIVVEQGSRLEFRNIVVKNISGNKIRALDNASIINLNNVTWQFDGNYSFSTGCLDFDNFVEFQGSSTFIFQSSRPITIHDASQLTLDFNFTFSYDTSSPDLFKFATANSLLILDNATLFANDQGLNLTHGAIRIAGNSIIASDSFVALGDCFTGTNDFMTTVLANGQLEIASGSLDYKNVNQSSFSAQGTSIVRTDGGAALNLYQILNLGAGTAVFGNNATIGNQFNLIGSSSQEGILNSVILPPC